MYQDATEENRSRATDRTAIQQARSMVSKGARYCEMYIRVSRPVTDSICPDSNIQYLSHAKGHLSLPLYSLLQPIYLLSLDFLRPPSTAQNGFFSPG